MRYCGPQGAGRGVTEDEHEKRFCPVHGDYLPRANTTACPHCDDDPIRARASLRSVQVITSEMAALRVSDDSSMGEPSDEHLTTIDDVASCPSCGRLVPLDEFQSEALGEVWEGEASLWAEDGVCRACYRDVIPKHLRRWTTEEWIAHHFEGWRAQVGKVHDLEVSATSEQDAWLPDEERMQILDVEATLSARREHLARASMRLRDLRGELGLAADPPQFVAEIEAARTALGPEARAQLEQQRLADLDRERARRVGSVTNLSPAQVLEEAGLDAEEFIGDLARSTGRHRGVDDEALAVHARAQQRSPRWPVVALGLALGAFVVWWFIR